MKIKRIRLPEVNKEQLLELLELMIYYKLSYPTGFHTTCEVQLDDKGSRILTPDIIYSMDEHAYCYLYMKSNEMIAAMYKEAHEEDED